MEHQRRGLSLVPWIILLVASIMLLFIVNSILRYAPSASGGTLFDAAGAVLPYALLVAVIFYHILKTDFKSIKLTLRYRPPKRNIRLSILFILGVILFVVPCVLVFLLFEIVGPNPDLAGSPSPTGPGGSWGPIELGPLAFDPWFLLGIFSVIFTLATLFAVASLGKRRKSIDEMKSDEEIGTKSIPLAPNRYVDDDYRRAIITYYAQSREHMASQGVPLTEAMTPREFRKNVLKSLSVAGKDFTSLTNLFEEARFSVHPLGYSEESKAKKHCERIIRIDSEGKMAEVE